MSTFTKKHYEFIADHIKMEVKSARMKHGEEGWPMLDALLYLSQSLAHSFKHDNLNFNENKFMEACGFEERSR